MERGRQSHDGNHSPSQSLALVTIEQLQQAASADAPSSCLSRHQELICLICVVNMDLQEGFLAEEAHLLLSAEFMDE